MKIATHISIILIAILILIGLGHFLPTYLNISPATLTLGLISKPTTPIKPPMPLKDTLAAVLNVQKKQSFKKGPETWSLGNGIPLPVYLLRAKRVIESRNGKIISMQEIFPGPKASIQWADSSGTITYTTIKYSDDYLQGSSVIGMAFLCEAPPDSILSAKLKALDIPLTLIVRPFKVHEDSTWKLHTFDSLEYVGWIGMEPHQYPWVTPGNKSILIHHKDADINSILTDAKKRLPNMKGIATYMGERAVEQQPLLETLFTILNKEQLWFLDLTQSRFSKTMGICESKGAHCKLSNSHSKSLPPEEYLTQVTKSASKNGKALAILYLSDKSILAASNMIATVKSQGTTFVHLTNLIQ